MKRDLTRLLRPKSIALFGGSWAENVIVQLQKTGFDGEIWPVHPKRDSIQGIACFASVDALPHAPDAAFIGVNRELTISVVEALSKMGAGGATCFASGFLESEEEAQGGADLQAALIKAAGDMPIIGPNCYGFLNYLDGISLWPDQHGGRPCEKGVAIIGQSSNILINLTMQKRGLPIAYAIAAGNQAQTGISDIGEALLEDDRVTAFGLFIEGFDDIRAFEAFAARAAAANKPIVAIKSGKSQKAQAATFSHTASLAGNSAASSAFLKRCGVVEVTDLSFFLETLKLMHGLGKLGGNAVSSMSCSGGEAGLIADLADHTNIHFREFSAPTTAHLKDILGPMVTLANPLDYHTYIWNDRAGLTATYGAVLADGFDLNVLVMDVPPPPRCEDHDWQGPLEAIKRAKQAVDAPLALIASLPENLTEEICDDLFTAGIVPLHGMETAIAAIDALIQSQQDIIGIAKPVALFEPMSAELENRVLDEAEAKAALRKFGVNFPKSVTGNSAEAIAAASRTLQFPLVLKGLGIEHKSEAGAVILNLQTETDILKAAQGITGAKGFLAEEMVDKPIAEMLVGVTKDATGLALMTLGWGGVMTELIRDKTSLLLPASREELLNALKQLKIYEILNGYRGGATGDVEALLTQIEAVQSFCLANPDLVELDINPVMVLQEGAIAVDALIVKC